MNIEIFKIILIPLIGTIIGSAFVFFIKNKIPSLLQKSLLGFAAGVMVAASVWSLLIPGMEMAEHMGKLQIIPAVVGLLLGFAFLYLIDMLTPHLHANATAPEGVKTNLSKTWKLALAVTIHNLPEGMAVGVIIASAIQYSAIVSMPMRTIGNSRKKSFIIGSLSGIVEPIGAFLTIALASLLTPILPYLLSFSAGAMLYVVVEELIPEASQGKHSNMATIGFAIGFCLMMVLDVILG